MAKTPRIVIIGAGAGGLAAAVDLAGAGLNVTVLEKADEEGGKIRQVAHGDARIDAGPTVFTMRWVFESLFGDHGQDLDQAMSLSPASILARHAWTSGKRLDLYADPDASAEAIGTFAGRAEAAAYRSFVQDCRGAHDTLRDTFMAAQKPSPGSLLWRVGDLGALWRTRPFETYGERLAATFSDPALRQMFGRYATYVGSSPFKAPATLMLIAHVEQEGVWIPQGGMHAVAGAMRRLAESLGAVIRTGAAVSEIRVSGGKATGVTLATGEEIEADAVVFNGDASALAAGLLGERARGGARPVGRKARSLSAVTWCLEASTRGFPLDYHNVFFADNYEREFDSIFRERTIPDTPTVYICAQDRHTNINPQGDERLLVLINAPADGDLADAGFGDGSLEAHKALRMLEACGLELAGGLPAGQVSTPETFNRLFPGTGGALYGRANHSSMASFARPGAATSVSGLYLAGGSAHPGAGVPMATLSGRLAAERLLRDYKLAP